MFVDDIVLSLNNIENKSLFYICWWLRLYGSFTLTQFFKWHSMLRCLDALLQFRSECVRGAWVLRLMGFWGVAKHKWKRNTYLSFANVNAFNFVQHTFSLLLWKHWQLKYTLHKPIGAKKYKILWLEKVFVFNILPSIYEAIMMNCLWHMRTKSLFPT